MSLAERFDHSPVMLREITDLFATVPAGTVVDATLGGGGHTASIHAAHPHLDVLGIDQDSDALAAAMHRLGGQITRLRTSHRRFDQFEAALDEHGVEGISGALFDLGVSSPQLDRGERGFSYRHEGPLDMRMNSDQQWSAADVVNGYEEYDLARIIKLYGDEKFAKRIAASIVAARPRHEARRPSICGTCGQSETPTARLARPGRQS